jgi:type IV pilus assembly protein PilO
MANFKEFSESIESQFRNLNGLSPWLWPLAPRMLSAFGLFVLVVCLGWFFHWSNQLEELDNGELEEQKIKELYKSKMQQAISLEALKEQRTLVLQYVSRMEKQLPSKAEIDALLGDINSAGVGRGLSFDLFKVGNTVVKDYYAELAIELKLIGNYHDLGQFIGDVAKLSRIVTLNDLKLVTSENPKKPGIVLDVVAKTFRYLDPEEVASQATQKKKDKDTKK